MIEPLVIGLDLGTTLCKASAFELDGSLVGSEQQAIRTYRPHSGWAEQDPLEWKEALISVLGKLAARLGENAVRVEAIGLSSHGPSLIPTDAGYRPLWRCPIWQDQRAAHLIDDLIERAGTDWIGLGTPESSFGVQLLWTQQNRPEVLEGAAHLFDTKGYLLAQLTSQAVDEPSSSPGGEGVNQELFEALGIDLSLMAKSVPSMSVVGGLVPEIRERVNLPASVKVVAGLNDGAAATLGAGIVGLGQGIVSLSTNGVMRTSIPSRLPGSLLREKSMFCYSYVDEMYITGGMTKCGADNVKWLMENFYREVESEAQAFERIAAEGRLSPAGANGMFFMPYLFGMGTPNPTKTPQGAFLNLGRHHQRADFTRALLEGAAFALRDIGETFNALGLVWQNLRFTGGGSKNPAWRQIVADILDKPLTGARSDSVLGVAMVAAASVGLFPSINEAVKKMVRQTFSVKPDPEIAAVYEALYQEFNRVKAWLGAYPRA
jgi:xylulokinase